MNNTENKFINDLLKFWNLFSRLHQAHVIDPLWCEVSQEMKTSMYTALKSAESIVKDNTMNYKEYEYLQATHYNAWKGKEIQPILSGKPDFKSTGNVKYGLLKQRV